MPTLSILFKNISAVLLWIKPIFRMTRLLVTANSAECRLTVAVSTGMAVVVHNIAHINSIDLVLTAPAKTGAYETNTPVAAIAGAIEHGFAPCRQTNAAQSV